VGGMTHISSAQMIRLTKYIWTKLLMKGSNHKGRKDDGVKTWFGRLPGGGEC